MFYRERINDISYQGRKPDQTQTNARQAKENKFAE